MLYFILNNSICKVTELIPNHSKSLNLAPSVALRSGLCGLFGLCFLIYRRQTQCFYVPEQIYKINKNFKLSVEELKL